jgi:hypothetical protein
MYTVAFRSILVNIAHVASAAAGIHIICVYKIEDTVEPASLCPAIFYARMLISVNVSLTVKTNCKLE